MTTTAPAPAVTAEPIAGTQLVPVSAWKHPNLAAALAAFQAELPEIKKGNTAQVRSDKGNYSYDYADLADISPVVLRLLGKHGLSWTTSPTMLDASGFVLTYQLLHESGESIDGLYPLPDARVPAQQLGSAITYARRYALCAVTGVAPGGDDDDAQSAQQVARAASQPEPSKRGGRQKPIVPSAPTRDWVAEANKLTSLEALTALANEADAAGELGLRSGEGTVIDGLRARRAQLEAESAPMALADPPARDWVGEAKVMRTWAGVRALIEEAKAGNADPGVLDQLLQIGQELPDETEPMAEPDAGWRRPQGD